MDPIDGLTTLVQEGHVTLAYVASELHAQGADAMEIGYVCLQISENLGLGVEPR